MSTAVLITCHNRKEKTIKCLSLLLNEVSQQDNEFTIYLVDDGSTDGTEKAVKSIFSGVNIIKGSGDLFWNQGMRLAWLSAALVKDYDFYIWLNDDTFLHSGALNHMFECYNEAKSEVGTEVIITGACSQDFTNKIFSYGGRDKREPVIPNDEIQKCIFINGNFVLVPKFIYQSIGNLSDSYTHSMGDFDYGLRAQKKGFKCYTTKKYVASCALNEGIPGWCDAKNNLKKRWRLFNAPTGLCIKEYIKFRKRFWPNSWYIYIIKAYAKMLFPKVYNKLS